MQTLDGSWRVEREAGVLPPFGLSKRIRGKSGWTAVAGVPVAFFRVVEHPPATLPGTSSPRTSLVYRGWPVRDELTRRADGTWDGRGTMFGREFCRFRLVRAEERNPAKRAAV